MDKDVAKNAPVADSLWILSSRQVVFYKLAKVNPEEQKSWMEQWKGAAAALEAVRAEELSRLDKTRNAEIAASLFVAPGALRQNSQTSGLVKQQALFQKALRK